MTPARTVLEIEIGEIVLHGLPAEHASYVDGLGPLVQQRLSDGGVVKLEIGQDGGDFERMGEIEIA